MGSERGNLRYTGILLAGLMVLAMAVAGCTSEQKEQKTSPEMYQEPEITIEKAKVISVSTNQIAIDKKVEPGQVTYGKALVTVNIRKLTIHNPDDAWLPPSLEEGNNITLLFMRSADPAKIVRIPMNVSGEQTEEKSETTRNQTVVGHEIGPTSKLISREKENGTWIFTISDPDVEEKQVTTLPGVEQGDIIRTELVYGRTPTVTKYEVLSD